MSDEKVTKELRTLAWAALNDALWKKLYHGFQFDRERFLRHYHKRSN